MDDITVLNGTKQFLTLTTRDGNFFYLIIDHDQNGNQNVHFLNQVDERDLVGLMDEDEAKELEEHLAQQEADRAAAEAALTADPTATAETKETPAPAPEPEPEPEAIFNIAGFEISQKHFVAAVGGTIVILIIIVAIMLTKRKKEAEADRPDPDADYDEEYGDEIEIPEGTFEDDDFKV